MGSPKEARDFIPFAADQGMPHLAGAAAAGVSIQMKKITLSGAAPHAINIAAQGLAAMENASYCVLVGGENGAIVVDESTITAAGFDLLNGVAADVVHLVIVGRLKGQAA